LKIYLHKDLEYEDYTNLVLSAVSNYDTQLKVK